MNRRTALIFFILTLILLFSSCSSPVKRQVPTISHEKIQARKQQAVDMLYNHYRHWRGTPYSMGGLSKKGVDCSGFVYLTYRTVAGITLPRTTRQQMKIGSEVSPYNLKPGDLLFFKTGWYTRHVGIYLQNGQFMHASTSHGVTLSELSEKYWQNSFYLAKRINIR